MDQSVTNRTTQTAPEAQTRAARKAELLHVFNTWRMQRLATFADSLSPEDAEILLEGYQEQLEKECAA
jgi:uncharacterized membrane protein